MEAMNLVEVVLNQGTDEDNDRSSNSADVGKTTPIKGLDESVTITVTRTPGRPSNAQRIGAKPENFALVSPTRNGRNSDAIRLSPREEMVCTGCQRVFKYKAAFLRHEAQCGLPIALRIERAALIEAKKQEKAAEMEKRKMEEKQEKEKLPDFRCSTCFKQFNNIESYQRHNFEACAAERATYTFICSVCKAKFKYKNHLRRHEDSHNNVRRYNCDVCTTAFLRPDHLKRHMMRMHGIVHLPSQGASEKIIMNPSPGPRASQSSDQRKTNIIIKNAPMQCPMCNKILSRRDHLLRHLRNVHHANLDSRKRGQDSEIFPGFEGLSDIYHGHSYQEDDDDGSENQSMTSHDGLLIDESFESIKRESESPSPIESDKETITSKYFNSPLNLEITSQMKSKSLNNGVQVKYVDGALAYQNSSKVERVYSNSSESNTSVLEHTQQDKTGQIDSSDDNQNVLPNGHGVQNPRDWMTDLAKFNGW